MISRIENIYLVETDCLDPAENMALEQYLTLHCLEKVCALFLWQNQDTVVIGRNQNMRGEVNLPLAESEGVRVIRRLSGGGAVFHDTGNLNYTFIARKKDFDIDAQSGVILRALEEFSIRAERSGRNDLLAEGRKFSGMAFYHSGDRHYQHGTLLAESDPEKVGRYLTPSESKKRRHAVASVASRIITLQELAPHLTVAGLKESLGRSFEEVYGMKAKRLTAEEFRAGLTDEQAAELEHYRDTFASKAWNLGRDPEFDIVRQRAFDWGEASVCLRVNGDGDTVDDCVIYTDALDQEFIGMVEEALRGADFDACALSESVLGLKADGDRAAVREDLSKMFH